MGRAVMYFSKNLVPHIRVPEDILQVSWLSSNKVNGQIAKRFRNARTIGPQTSG
ncbi:MAG: hypothetical protein RLZZ458_2980, partial [Planctomycetota bacterium]